MAGNNQKSLEVATIAGNDLKWLEMAINSLEIMDMDIISWMWLEMAGHCIPWLEGEEAEAVWGWGRRKPGLRAYCAKDPCRRGGMAWRSSKHHKGRGGEKIGGEKRGDGDGSAALYATSPSHRVAKCHFFLHESNLRHSIYPQKVHKFWPYSNKSSISDKKLK